MTGVQEFNKKFENTTKAVIQKSGLPILEDFYNYVLLGHEASTTHQYVHHVNHFMKTVGKTDASELCFNDYTKYFASIKNTTASHQIGVYSALKCFSKFLKANKLNEDYMVTIDRPRKKESAETIAKREEDVMSTKQIKAYLKKVSSSKTNDIWKQRDYTMIKVFLSCGIRRAALQKLDVSDIDLENGIMKVTEKGARVRDIYLSEELINDIKTWMSYRSGLNVDTKALFVSNRKTRMTTVNINYIVKKYDDNVHPHEFRASYATALYKNTGDLYFVQQCMGHSTPGMTERYIRGQKNDASLRAANIMSKII